jgi:tripartite-type tricarboxylate transporter receptor subunit TctC
MDHFSDGNCLLQGNFADIACDARLRHGDLNAVTFRHCLMAAAAGASATFCRQTIERLAQQYDAPVFVPHLASAIGNVSFREVASRAFSSASRS